VGFHHLVRPGDTLGKIAGKYGSSVRAVQQANRLSSPNRIHVGQKLLIPPSKSRPSSKAGRSPAQGKTASTAGGTRPIGTYTVRPGDTLSSIARRFGTSAEALMATNGLTSPDRLSVGQTLRLAGSAEGSNATTHVVRSGETLASIARRYGISVKSLQQVNRISNHIIRPQQVLLIPR
jgi:LysM repeat protein